ncbi:MATE family efflux transporter [uncultured Peptoniphilus sp.]|uniref:Probable multidrug resistance protein NorM n=1 Tax=Peptoniphilus gorbachii TaxID=411567 RepID=A0A6N3B532_9FIRM|nr:MATE family efflux transporter [uncultured Peptoniphilus sp.]MDU6784045.1 MATE family efflux transporter [Peptoniphilus harei]
MQSNENKLGTMSIPKLLFQVSFPIVVSMFIQSMYNLVDSYYIGKINEEAFTAISIAFPIQNIMIGIAVGTGVGMNSLISRYLGEKNYEKSNRTAETGLALAIIYGIILLILSRFLPRPFLSAQTTNENIIAYGIDYLQIVMGLSIGVFTQIFLERTLQSTGRSIFTMLTQLIGAVLNIILDPIFIFGYFGLPAMGVKGAAIATVTGQIIGALFGSFFEYKFNKEITIKKPVLDLDIVKGIYVVGVPSMITITIQSFTIYVLNKMLSEISTSAIAALGAYFKVQSFVFMPIFGVNNGLVPIVAYNYGAKNKDRIIKTIKLAFITVTFMMIFVSAIIIIFPRELLGIFSASGKMLEIGIPMLRICALSYVFAGISIVGTAVFQAFGNGILALFDSILRQIIVLLPVAYIAIKFFTVNEIWWGYVIAEFASTLFVIYLMNTFVRKKLELI